jgi:hypothetical protein
MGRYPAMNELTVYQGPIPQPRASCVREALEAYQTAAWRAPGATRFDGRPANDVKPDFLTRAEAVAPTHVTQPVATEPMPRWLIVALGAVIAAILGALVGGALAV